jgi:hypothetical protein
MTDQYKALGERLHAISTELETAGFIRGSKLAVELFDLVCERMPMIHCALVNHARLAGLATDDQTKAKER